MPLPLIPVAGAAVIQVLIAGLRIMLIANIAGMVLRLLFVLGLDFLVLAPITDNVMALLTDKFGLLPDDVADWIAYLNIDRYVSIILSAMGLSAGINFVLRLNN